MIRRNITKGTGRVGTTAVPSLQMTTPRLREGKSVAQGHTARKQQKLGSKAQRGVTVIYIWRLLFHKSSHEDLGPSSNPCTGSSKPLGALTPVAVNCRDCLPQMTMCRAFLTHLSSVPSQPWRDDPHYTDGKSETQFK